MLNKFLKALSKTRHQLGDGLATLFLGKKEINQALFDELEALLIRSDVGIDTTQMILQDLTEQTKRRDLKDPGALLAYLKADLTKILKPLEQPLTIASQNTPHVILVVGVNGAGKTTTLGKLAKFYQNQGHSVMLAAGDTFRSAATEQLQVWGERNQVPVVAQHQGADSASVLYDAVSSAKAKNIDVLLADTAGRLHNKSHLMEELKKIIRVIQKIDSTAPHEILLVLDASIGQNGLNQAKVFHEQLNLTGLAISKLDGTAKGGVIFSIAKSLGLPIRFIATGEQINDIAPFQAQPFVSALFDE